MDGFAFVSKPATLFGEDFDLAEVAPEPEVIEPMFSASELADARETAWREGNAAGLRESAEGDVAVTRLAVESIAASVAAECAAAAARAEQTAEAIAGLLLDSLAAAFPVLCARYGDAEVRAVVRTVLPALTREQAITVRANPITAAALAGEFARLDPDLAAHVQTIECDAMARGDVRITWQNGGATRDAVGLWQQIADVLVPAGLMRTDAAIRETIDG
jgi:flagellar biosynthesis/type III secretory pathway protein FliH